MRWTRPERRVEEGAVVVGEEGRRELGVGIGERCDGAREEGNFAEGEYSRGKR